jgi:hypothetical protein
MSRNGTPPKEKIRKLYEKKQETFPNEKATSLVVIRPDVAWMLCRLQRYYL